MEIGANRRSLAVGVWPGSTKLDGCVKEPMMEGRREAVPGWSAAPMDAHTHLRRRGVRRRGLMEGTETATEGINKGVKYGDRRKLGVKIKAEEAEGWRTG